MAEPQIIETKVQSFQQTAHCPHCDRQLQWTGVTLTVYPPLFPHRCNQCDKTWNLSYCYPHIVTRSVED